jgi:hypothetical protein
VTATVYGRRKTVNTVDGGEPYLPEPELDHPEPEPMVQFKVQAIARTEPKVRFQVQRNL